MKKHQMNIYGSVVAVNQLRSFFSFGFESVKFIQKARLSFLNSL
jgi:hypothetical protein